MAAALLEEAQGIEMKQAIEACLKEKIGEQTYEDIKDSAAEVRR